MLLQTDSIHKKKFSKNINAKAIFRKVKVLHIPKIHPPALRLGRPLLTQG